MSSKYKPNFERDYLFYLQNKDKFTFAGSIIPKVNLNPHGVDAKKAFWAFDSQGKNSPCREPELFRQLLICKKAINLQITMWAEGQEDCLIPIKEMLESFIGTPPDWVEASIRNQIEKVSRKKYRS